MEYQHQPSIIWKPSNDFKLCAVTLDPIKRLPYPSKVDSHEIGVFLFFHHKLEIHQHCKNSESPYQEDHNILWTEPTNQYYRAIFVMTPQKPEMIEGYVADELITCNWDNGLPSYVSPAVLGYVSAKVSQYLQKNVIFDDEIQWFTYELTGIVDVSTIIDVTHL